MNAPHDEKQARAVEKILAGDDADMADLTLRELRSQKTVYRPLVEQLAGSPDPRVRSRARLLLRFWTEPKEPSHGSLLAGFQLRNWEDLEAFCWDLAQIENPEADLQEGKDFLGGFGEVGGKKSKKPMNKQHNKDEHKQ